MLRAGSSVDDIVPAIVTFGNIGEVTGERYPCLVWTCLSSILVCDMMLVDDQNQSYEDDQCLLGSLLSVEFGLR